MSEAEAGEKTEAPTPQRVEEARRRGEVAVSRDLVGAVVLVAVLVALSYSPSWWGRLVWFVRRAVADAASGPVRSAQVWRAVDVWGRTAGPPLAAAVALAALCGALQTRGLWAPGAVRLDFSRALPAWRRVLGLRAGMEIAKGILKVGMVALVVWVTARHLARPVLMAVGARGTVVLGITGHAVETLVVRLAVAALSMGVLDYLWQQWQHTRRLRMTRDEVRRQHMEREGDPKHKAERQRLHRELLEQRMVADVRKADFIVVNPDHIAVAVRYDRAGEGAPVVVAKGDRLLAARIKQVAREAGVPIFRDVGLARALRDVREGDEIPEALYEAIAEILRVVYGSPPATNAAASPAPVVDGSWRRG